MRKQMVLALVLVLLMGLFSGCSKQEGTNEPNGENGQSTEVVDELSLSTPISLSFASGTTTGTMYVYSGGVASIANSLVKNLDIMVESSGGGGTNVELLRTGDVDLMIAESSLVYDKYFGIKLEGDEKAEDFAKIRTLFPAYVHQFIAVTTEETGITSLEESVGKTIGVGPLGGSGDTSVQAVYSSLGWDAKRLTGQWGNCVTELADGRCDLVAVSTGHPSPPLTDLETKRKVLYLPLSSEQIAIVRESYPYYSESVIPAGMYKSMTEDYLSLGNWVCVFTTTDMSEEVAYTLTKVVMENNPQLVNAHPAAVYTKPENAADLSIPIHPGALKYYEECGIDIPEELIVD